jgi:hypothetical protein
MLIAGASSILARGIIEEIEKSAFYIACWFLAYLPCRSSPFDLLANHCVGCIRRTQRLAPGGREYLRRNWTPWPLVFAEKRCAFLTGMAVVLWMTDFIHHLSPSLVGLMVGLLAITRASVC